MEQDIQKLRLDHATLRGAMTVIVEQLGRIECCRHEGEIVVLVRIGEAALDGKTVGEEDVCTKQS